MKYKELKKVIKEVRAIFAYTLLYGIPEENNKDGEYLQVTKKEVLSIIDKANRKENALDFNVSITDNYLYIN